MIAYGIMGTASNIDPDKTYDYNTAFDIKPTEVVYNVDFNTNNKKILNIALDKNSNNSAATVGMVKELIPFTTNILYRKYFEEFYALTEADIYGLKIGVSGVVFNSLKPNISLPDKYLSLIKKDGLQINGYKINFDPPSNVSNYTLCIVFVYWRNRNFSITKKNKSNNSILLHLYYLKVNNSLNLVVNNITRSFPMPSRFNGERIVLWLAETFDANVTKVSISNSSSTLTIPTVHYTNEQKFEFTTQDGVLNKLMYSPNFYDFDSVEYHKIMLQEKLNGSYID